MNKIALGVATAALFATSVVVARRAESAPQVATSLPYVRLQTDSPGTQQGGHINVSGTGLFGSSLGIGTSAPAAALDVTGNALVRGSLGVGNAAPAYALDVTGAAKVDALLLPSGAAAGYVLTSDASGNATWQPAAGFALPFVGSASSATSTFDVTNTNATAFTSAGSFVSDAPSGRGVVGKAGGIGVYGVCTSGAGYGGYFESNGSGGNCYGLYGQASGPGGGTGYGVYGISNKDIGYGVEGVSSSYHGFGVSGQNGGGGVGVDGYSLSSTGGVASRVAPPTATATSASGSPAAARARTPSARESSAAIHRRTPTRSSRAGGSPLAGRRVS